MLNIAQLNIKSRFAIFQQSKKILLLINEIIMDDMKRSGLDNLIKYTVYNILIYN